MRLACVTATLAAAACAHAPPRPDIRQLSHAIVEAFDRGDVATIDTRLATGFVQTEQGEPHDRASELERLRERRPDAPHIASRTWSREHAFATGDTAVFIGDAAERSSGNRGGYTYDGRYTLAWRYEAGAWKLALWVWSRAGAVAERETWNEIFQHGSGFEKAPNRLLVTTVASLAPGAALDIASGQGRNVLYLAAHGWRATGVDFSHEGMEQARAAAKVQRLPVDLVETDLDTTDLGSDKYDLVTMIYAGSDPKIVAKAQRALKPGGVFVCEYFHDTPDDKGGFATGALAKLFAGYDILRDDVVVDVPDWAVDRASLVRFVARKR
jgi:hypothetical protein